MTDAILISGLLLIAAVLILQIVLFRRKLTLDLSPLQTKLELIQNNTERTDRSLRDELSRSREEISFSSRQVREEISAAIQGIAEALQSRIVEISALLTRQFETFHTQNFTQAENLQQELGGIRNDLTGQLNLLLERTSQELTGVREQSGANSKCMREELALTLKNFNDSVLKSMSELVALQKSQSDGLSAQVSMLTTTNQEKLDSLRNVVDERLRGMQEDNMKQLEQMRVTVDEKLQGTLEKRLGESFRQVSERLEEVHKGLGEMQGLAAGVGDLKRALTNVKVRGGWAEIQLEMLLEQILSPEQFAKKVRTKDDSDESVEFAIRFPADKKDSKESVLLPIDAKFPMECYQRLVEAYEKGDRDSIQEAERALVATIKICAKDIWNKYINPPITTDFAIMYLPTEGLYAEVVRRPGMIESLQQEFRVTIAGPSTITGFLNSLQMGFRTLAVEKRSSEVWNLLGAVKTEFGKFGIVLEGVKKKLDQASNTMDEASRRSRAIERKLREVQELPATEPALEVESPEEIFEEE